MTKYNEKMTVKSVTSNMVIEAHNDEFMATKLSYKLLLSCLLFGTEADQAQIKSAVKAGVIRKQRVSELNKLIKIWKAGNPVYLFSDKSKSLAMSDIVKVSDLPDNITMLGKINGEIYEANGEQEKPKKAPQPETQPQPQPQPQPESQEEQETISEAEQAKGAINTLLTQGKIAEASQLVEELQAMVMEFAQVESKAA